MFNERSLTSTELLMSLAILQLLSSFVDCGRLISDVLNNIWEERKDILCNHIFSCILVLKGRRKMHVELRPWLNIQGITMFCAVTISWENYDLIWNMDFWVLTKLISDNICREWLTWLYIGAKTWPCQCSRLMGIEKFSLDHTQENDRAFPWSEYEC